MILITTYITTYIGFLNQPFITTLGSWENDNDEAYSIPLLKSGYGASRALMPPLRTLVWEG